MPLQGWLLLLAFLVGTEALAQVEFSPTNYTFEAEDFNFQGGGFFDDPVLCDTIGGGPNCYFDRVGYTNIDKLELDFAVTIVIPLTNEVYRWGSITAFAREEWVDTFITDDPLVRTQYVAAAVSDYEVRNVVEGEWLNYTRTYPAGNYSIYMRVSSPGPLAARLELVDNATTPTQNLTTLGRFITTGATSGYQFVPLTDDSGANEIVVTFSGASPATLRVTALSDGFLPNFYMLVPSTNAASLPPTVTITNPADGAALQEGVEVILAADAIDPDGTINNVQFFAGTTEPLTLIGETDALPYSVPWTPPSLGSIRTYTIRVVATDGSGLTGSDQIKVEVSDPAIQSVSTAQDEGADAELREEENRGVTSGASGDLNTRSNNSTDNELVALRFDLAGRALARLADVKLNLINFRNNSARQIALYGVAPGTAGATGRYTTEDWDENDLAEFGDMPGLLAADGDMATRSLNMDSLTLLDTYTYQSLTKGSVETLDDPAITAFVRGYGGSGKITFLVTAAPGYTSNGQGRFASKEATALDGGAPAGEAGDFAPFLQFRVLENAAPLVTITNPVAGAELVEGTEVVIAVDATDTDGSVTNVQFYAGTAEPLTFLGEDSTTPFGLPWTPPVLGAVGFYTIRVVATDNNGQSAEDSITVTVSERFRQIVTTAVGDGADVEMQEQDNDGNNNASMNVRTSPNADRNEITALRFDLSGYTLSDLENVTLNVVSFRNDTSTRGVALYGVAPGTAAREGSYTAETWDETALPTFGSLPGLLPTDDDFLTPSIDPDHTTYLDAITVAGAAEGDVQTFSSPALTSFVRSLSGSSLVTFLLADSLGSSGQFRMASKEAAALTTISGNQGDFAPFLSFILKPASLGYQLTGGGTGIEFSWTGEFKLQVQTNSLGIDPSAPWFDYPDSGNPVTVPVDPANRALFFRLASP